MANNSLIVIFYCFLFWLSNAIAASKNETVLEIPKDLATQHGNTGESLIANQTDTTQHGMLFDRQFWCCKSGTTYLPGLDQCVPNEVSTLYNESFPSYSYPNDGLADCPDGYVSHSTQDFQLDNGTLWIDGGKQLKSNEFCINRVEEENYSTSSGNFVARYCVPDPCTTPGCIRKCCPSDMALVMKYYHDLSPISKCESHPEKLNLSLLRNKQNESIDVKSTVIHGGLGIKCGDVGVDAPYEVSRFSIDSDGQILLFSENHPKGRKSDQYCIDNFVDKETNVSITLKFKSHVHN